MIDFDDIWKWIGFSRKDHAKVILNKHFVADIDYKILFPQPKENLKQNNCDEEQILLPQLRKQKQGGHNKEQILITVNTFKKFCLKAGTKKADEIHDYYIKLEELMQETLNEESDELRNQLAGKNAEHEQNLKMSKHNILIDQLKTKRCVYIGEIKENELIKIGSSADVYARKYGLNKTFDNCIFLEMFECDNFREIEQKILHDPIIKQHLYKKLINGHISKEVVELTKNFNYEQVLFLVKKYVADAIIFTPEQLIETQKLNIEQQKLDLNKQKLMFNTLELLIKEKQSSNVIEQHLNTMLHTIFENTIIDTNVSHGMNVSLLVFFKFRYI